MKSEGASFLLAVQFLTRFPVKTARLYTPERMAKAVRYYPLVGALVGAASAIAFVLVNLALPSAIAIIIAIAVGVLITGAFHEDGLADTFDGLGGGLSREQALQIMKDSRLGTYGTLALIIALGLKAATLIAMPTAVIPMAFVVAHGLSRLSSVWVIATSRYVREDGKAKPVADAASRTSLLIALATGAALIALWCVWLPPIALIWGGAGLLAGHFAMRFMFERKLGGYTGDTLGAVQQASEIGFYLGLLAWL